MPESRTPQTGLTTVAQIVPASGQILRLEPIVGQIYGGGTSAVVVRGHDANPADGVRVSVEQPSTSAPPHSAG